MQLIFRLRAAIAALCIAAPAFAGSTTVQVREDGEGGGPMTLKLDQTSIKAGPTTFSVHNDATGEEHEMVLVKLASPGQTIPLDTAKHKVDEDELSSLGEVEDLKPGDDGQLKADLKPGSYLLLCNLKGHYEAGMQARLEVTP